MVPHRHQHRDGRPKELSQVDSFAPTERDASLVVAANGQPSNADRQVVATSKSIDSKTTAVPENTPQPAPSTANTTGINMTPQYDQRPYDNNIKMDIRINWFITIALYTGLAVIIALTIICFIVGITGNSWRPLLMFISGGLISGTVLLIREARRSKSFTANILLSPPSDKINGG